MHNNHQNRSNNQKPTTVPVTETPETPVKKEDLGIVTGCSSLLIREKPNKDADIVTTISAGSEVMINRKDSTADFYKVCSAAGIEGFCMRQYIEIRS